MDFADLFASLLFGCVGFAAWQVGRRRQSARPMVLGLALIGLPWLIPSGWTLWAVGAGLTALVFVP